MYNPMTVHDLAMYKDLNRFYPVLDSLTTRNHLCHIFYFFSTVGLCSVWLIPVPRFQLTIYINFSIQSNNKSCVRRPPRTKASWLWPINSYMANTNVGKFLVKHIKLRKKFADAEFSGIDNKRGTTVRIMNDAMALYLTFSQLKQMREVLKLPKSIEIVCRALMTADADSSISSTVAMATSIIPNPIPDPYYEQYNKASFVQAMKLHSTSPWKPYRGCPFYEGNWSIQQSCFTSFPGIAMLGSPSSPTMFPMTLPSTQTTINILPDTLPSFFISPPNYNERHLQLAHNRITL